MWQTDWAEKPRQTADSEGPQSSSLAPANVASTYLLSWTEHCIECAIPDCYALCPLYVRRRDRKCARFKNGISPNPQYPGLFSFGAEIEFRRWGKLESAFGFGPAETVAIPMARPDRPWFTQMYSSTFIVVPKGEPIPPNQWRLRSVSRASAANNYERSKRRLR